MKKSVAISVIVPVYNIENYLLKCLESLRHQTFESYEVILVNDGSTDNSGKIAEDYAKSFSEKFQYVCQKNKGLSEARNTGMQYARGKYVCFVDSDDYVEPTYLEEMFQCAQIDDADLVFCAFQSVDEKGQVLKVVREHGFETGTTYTLTERKDLLITENAAWNKLYRKQIIDDYELRFTPGVWYEDMRFVKKYMLFAQKCVYCDSILLNYLIRQGSIMNSMGSKRNIEIIDAIEEVIEFYKQNGVYEAFEKEIEFLAIDHMYISTLVRLLRAGEKEQFKIVQKAFEGMFPRFKENQYISGLKCGRKMIYQLLNYKMYWMIRMIFSLREKK